MQRGRILIMGQTKENTYELRNMLDRKNFELEIALSSNVGKAILSQRKMSLLVLHTEALSLDLEEFFEFLDDRGIEIPVMLFGEESKTLKEKMPLRSEVTCFEKPYPVDDVMTMIQDM